ncbi:hypothetical protein OSTOST_23313 [Ostertagia ostertagi]
MLGDSFVLLNFPDRSVRQLCSDIRQCCCLRHIHQEPNCHGISLPPCLSRYHSRCVDVCELVVTETEQKSPK